MDSILEQILSGLNTGIGFAGSIITLYDHFKNQDDFHNNKIFVAIRNKSKEAYDSYCEYRQYRKDEIGTPLEEDILGYWESCLKRDTIPSVTDMVSLNIASKAEAEIMLAYLLEAWMENPNFVEWLHDIFAQNKLDKLSKTLISLQKNLEGVSGLANQLKQHNISDVAFTISPKCIIDAKNSCTDLDVKRYYMVDNRFVTMFKVICAEQDIPHMEISNKVENLIEDCHPVIIAGNGGLGKTSLMMRAAVQWASCGKVAVWLSLSNKDVITEQKATAFFNHLAASIPVGQRALLCIDNPYEGKVSFSNLQKTWPNNNKIQLIMAERANRLTLLADPDQDFLLYWFDDAQMILLQGLRQSEPTLNLKDYISYPFPETQERRKKILEKCTLFLVGEGIVEEKDNLSSIEKVLSKYGKPTVSLVELIYRTLFELKKRASKPGDIKLDWEEWGSFVESEFGKGEAYAQKELYGIIAALKIFNTPITITLFCKYFELKERKLKSHLKERLMAHHIEPVIFQNNTLQPKHDVIAELFFLFHEKTVSINFLMLNLLQCMDENEIELLLANMVNKREFQKGKKYHVGQINYRDYMDEIYNRIAKNRLNLSNTGRANLCLGYLWSRFQQNASGNIVSLNSILNKIAPEIDCSLIVAKFYTEWGILARDLGDNTLAEEKYRMVIDSYPTQLPARTELGKLLSKQKGREKEAEEVLREVIKIDSKNIMSRTELGKLLSKQKGREKEAEEVLREVIKIDSKNIMSRTELGKLLSKQKGREKEAEEVLREVIKIDPRNLHARTVLAKLFEDCNRQIEAVLLYQEVCKYNPGNLYGESGLKRLKKYMK